MSLEEPQRDRDFDLRDTLQVTHLRFATDLYLRSANDAAERYFRVRHWARHLTAKQLEVSSKYLPKKAQITLEKGDELQTYFGKARVVDASRKDGIVEAKLDFGMLYTTASESLSQDSEGASPLPRDCFSSAVAVFETVDQCLCPRVMLERLVSGVARWVWAEDLLLGVLSFSSPLSSLQYSLCFVYGCHEEASVSHKLTILAT